MDMHHCKSLYYNKLKFKPNLSPEHYISKIKIKNNTKKVFL